MMSKLPEEGRQGRESGDRFPALFSVAHTDSVVYLMSATLITYSLMV